MQRVTGDAASTGMELCSANGGFMGTHSAMLDVLGNIQKTYQRLVRKNEQPASALVG